MNFDAAAGVPGASPQQQSLGYVFDAGQTSFDVRPESTLLRIRGSLGLEKNSEVGVELFVHAFGIGVMETTAANLGAFPNPASPLGADWDGWMFYRSIHSSVVDAAGSIIDVKAMRKIQSGYSLIFVAGVYASTVDDSNATAPAINAQFTGRGLFLLP